MAYRTTYITRQGAILAAKTLESKTLKFSRFAVGNGELENADVDNIKALTDLVNTIKSFNITKISTETDTQVTIKGLFKNTDVEESFYLKELGLYAIDPDTQNEVLFAYINYGDQAEYINNSIAEKKEHYYDMIITVDNAENVEITVNENAIYVTEKQLKETLDNLQNHHIYGVKRNIESSSPLWERIGDSIGLTAKATHDGTGVHNDFDAIYPWSDIITYNYNVTTKQVTAFIGEPDFKFDGTNGEVMTRFPEFWWKREQKLEADGNTYEYVYIADYAEEGFTKSEQFSLSRYTASTDNDLTTETNIELHSKTEKNPLVSVTAGNLRTYAKAIGDNWGMLDIWHWSILQLLYLVEYANYNSQEELGLGRSQKDSTDTAISKSGECNLLGMKSRMSRK